MEAVRRTPAKADIGRTPQPPEGAAIHTTFGRCSQTVRRNTEQDRNDGDQGQVKNPAAEDGTLPLDIKLQLKLKGLVSGSVARRETTSQAADVFDLSQVDIQVLPKSLRSFSKHKTESKGPKTPSTNGLKKADVLTHLQQLKRKLNSRSGTTADLHKRATESIRTFPSLRVTKKETDDAHMASAFLNDTFERLKYNAVNYNIDNLLDPLPGERMRCKPQGGQRQEFPGYPTEKYGISLDEYGDCTGKRHLDHPLDSVYPSDDYSNGTESESAMRTLESYPSDGYSNGTENESAMRRTLERDEQGSPQFSRMGRSTTVHRDYPPQISYERESQVCGVSDPWDVEIRRRKAEQYINERYSMEDQMREDRIKPEWLTIAYRDESHESVPYEPDLNINDNNRQNRKIPNVYNEKIQFVNIPNTFSRDGRGGRESSEMLKNTAMPFYDREGRQSFEMLKNNDMAFYGREGRKRSSERLENNNMSFYEREGRESSEVLKPNDMPYYLLGGGDAGKAVHESKADEQYAFMCDRQSSGNEQRCERTKYDGNGTYRFPEGIDCGYGISFPQFIQKHRNNERKRRVKPQDVNDSSKQRVVRRTIKHGSLEDSSTKYEAYDDRSYNGKKEFSPAVAKECKFRYFGQDKVQQRNGKRDSEQSPHSERESSVLQSERSVTGKRQLKKKKVPTATLR